MIEPKLTEKELGKQMGNSDRIIDRYRVDKKRKVCLLKTAAKPRRTPKGYLQTRQM